MDEKEIYLEGAKDVLEYIKENMPKRRQSADLGRKLAEERVEQLGRIAQRGQSSALIKRRS